MLNHAKILIKKYFEEQGFVRSDIESFNNFVKNELQKIVDEVTAERPSRFKWGERKKYNRLVKDLAKIIPKAQHLRQHSFIHPSAPEGKAMLFGILGALTLGVGVAYFNDNLDFQKLSSSDIYAGRYGAIVGVPAYIYGLFADSTRKIKSRVQNVQHYIKYIDEVLGR